MGRKTKLRDLVGIIKDKASLSKAAILSNPNTLALHLSALRATTHDPSNPPSDKHISTLLTFGHGSRSTASAVIEALMDRLHHTCDSSVALKCLIIIHNLIKRGSFILQDQLSIYPTFGGRNYLNLSNFKDTSTPATWDLSSWVRWYANYLEHLLSTSRILGFFLSSISSSLEREKVGERVSSLMNKDLLREIDSLVSLVQETSKLPDSLHLEGNKLVYEVMGLVGIDYVSVINEVSPRIEEFKERLSCLTLCDSVELVCDLKRLEDCKERLMALFTRKIVTSCHGEMFWVLVCEVKYMIGMSKGYGGDDQGKLVVIRKKRETVSESARFGDRVLLSGDSLRFSSGRFSFINEFQLPVLEPVNQGFNPSLNYEPCTKHMAAIYPRWDAPPHGRFKLNADCSAMGNPRKASSERGGGGVIRNHLGLWITGYARRIGNGSRVPAELWALKDGLTVALQLNLTPIVVECDTSSVVSRLNNKKSYIFHVHNALINDCKQLMTIVG